MKKLLLFEEFDFEEDIEETDAKYRFKIIIGDWSGDGHGKSDYFVFRSNYDVKDIQQAYKDSCKLTGVQFNDNENNYTGKDLYRQEDRMICVEYEEYHISEFAVDVLKKYNIDTKKFDEYVKVDDFADLIMDFIKLSLPNMIYREAYFKRSELKSIPAVNGWGATGDLKYVAFGYGLYT